MRLASLSNAALSEASNIAAADNTSSTRSTGIAVKSSSIPNTEKKRRISR